MGVSDTNRVLWAGVDTLEVSYSGGLLYEWREYLDQCKERARRGGSPVPVTLAGEPLAVQRQGLKPWAWLLIGPDFHIRLGRGYVGHSVRLLSAGLAAHGADALLARAEAVISAVGTFTNVRVSRIDVAMDFQGWVPQLSQMVGATCPASFRPIYPSLQRPETYQYGRGAIVARVYNKTREIASRGSHWPGVWVAHPGFDPDSDVWRVEFQYRTDALRDRGILTASEALAAAGDLAATGFSWLVVREESADDDNHRYRAAVLPEWADLASSWAEYEPLKRTIEVRHASSAHALVPMVSGCLVTIGAHLGLQNPHEVAAWLVAAMGDRDADAGVDFAGRVRARERELYGAATVDGLMPGYAYTGLF